MWKRRQAALSTSSAKLVAHTIWIVQFAFSCSVWRRRWRPWLRSDTEVTWGRDKENGGRWGDGFWRRPPTASLGRPSRGGTRIRKSNFRAAGTSEAVAWRRRSVGAAQRLSRTIWQARLRHHHQCQQRLPSTNTTVEKDDRYAQSGKLNLSQPQNERKVYLLFTNISKNNFLLYYKRVILALKSM